MRFKTISVALTLVAGVFLGTAVLRSQSPAVGPVWEYAMVTPSGAYSEALKNSSTAIICYATQNGCRTEQVKADFKDFRSPGGGLVAAAAKLGESGWELASATESSSDNHADRTLYFKRLRSAIHRND